MGYFDWLDPGLGRDRTMALSQALLGLGAGMLGEGPSAYPQSFAGRLARGGAGFGAGLQQGLENARRDQRPAAPAAGPAAAVPRLVPLAAPPVASGAMPAAPVAAFPLAGPGSTAPRRSSPGQSRATPLEVDGGNAITVAKGIVASGKPIWLKGLDGTVGLETPENAQAFLKQYESE